jgi:biofilm PGA synthesis N-glycosyltransferase PgaC
MDAPIMYACLFISLYFEVFMLVSFLRRRSAAVTIVHDRATGYEPSVAIVVPCFNESETLAATIGSLLALDYPKDKLEIIVVDDGSTDHTLAVARQFETITPAWEPNSHVGVRLPSAGPRVSVFHKENGGKHTAMNFALARTNAELIGCLDADSIVSPDALRKITPIFENPKISAVTPGIHTKRPENLLQHMQEAEYRLGIFVRFTLAALGSAYITPGPFSIFRADVVRETGGWKHGHSTEDLEMALRMQDAGYMIANAPGAVVYTGTPRTIRALFRQRVRWSYGFLRNGIDYRHMFASRKYGNLGIIILPTALLSIGIAVYFFIHLLVSLLQLITHQITRIEILGLGFHPSFNAFYINTSALWIIVVASVSIVIGLISVGTYIGTGSRRPPAGTALFILFYSMIAPLWLGTAAIRAAFKAGVRWR